MRRWAPFSATLPLALCAGLAAGQQTPGPPWLNELLAADGVAYEAARGAALARPGVRDALRASLEGAVYGPSNWRRLVLAEALSMHLTHPEKAEALRSLDGLDSERYLLHRKPEPSAARELRQLDHVAPLMIELFLKGIETYGWSNAAAAAAEARALRRDLLFAIGRSGHPASVHLLLDVVEGGCACCESCAAAVAALGATGSLAALPALLRVRDDARASGDAGALAGAVEALGGLRHAETWPHIESGLRDADGGVRVAALRSAARYGSRWHWRDEPDRGAALRAVVGSAVLEALAAAEEEGVVLAALEALSVLATQELRESLAARQAGDAAAASPGAVLEGRFGRALDRVDRTLARRRGLGDREREFR